MSRLFKIIYSKNSIISWQLQSGTKQVYTWTFKKYTRLPLCFYCF